MSIRNQRTGRHEDDIEDRAARSPESDVSINELLAHAEEIIAETPEAFGTTTSKVVARLCELVRDNARTGERIDLDAMVPLNGWD